MTITQTDLALLLQGYENMIRLNEAVIRTQSDLLKRQEEIFRKIDDVDPQLGKILAEIRNTTGDISHDLIETKIDNLKDHTTIKIRLIWVYALLGSIGISLISVIYQLTTKYNLLQQIALKLGVNI